MNYSIIFNLGVQISTTKSDWQAIYYFVDGNEGICE